MSNHVNNGDCHVNYEGSSPATEDEAAVVFWQRSIENTKCGTGICYLTEIAYPSAVSKMFTEM